MKLLFVLTAIAASSLILTPQAAQAGKVGKIAGKYSGNGLLIDKRSAPISTYQYTFDNLQIKVSGSGKVSGSATVTAFISSGGSPFLPIGTMPVSATGSVTDIKKTKSKITGAGSLAFSDGTQVSGNFSVSAKTGKGTFKVKMSTAEFDANFKVSKKK